MILLRNFKLNHIDFVLQMWIESHYTNHFDWGHHTCFGLDFVDALNKLFASNYAPNVYWPSMIGDLFSWALLVCHMLVICLHGTCIWGVVTSHVVASNSRIYKMLSMFISNHPNNMLHNMQQQVIKLRIIVMCNFILPWNLENIFFKIPNAFSTRPSSMGKSMVRWLKRVIWKSLI